MTLYQTVVMVFINRNMVNGCYNLMSFNINTIIMNTGIKHHPERHRFEIQINGVTGYVEYEESAAEIDITHTIVPSEIGGRGIGTDLVKYALAYARVEHMKVIPSCSFVAAMMDKHEVYKDLRA